MILITGGIRSGKSRFALELALKMGEKRAFVATALPIDEEMKSRIEKHRRERGDLFETFEEPIEVPRVLQKLRDYDVVVVDCLTVWLGNLFYYSLDVDTYIRDLLESVSGNEIFVTNEVGMGVIPADAFSRRYVEKLGELNSRLANFADEVYLMVSGLRVKLK